MSDIFLSYANVDMVRVRPLIEALERRGWSVWWDRIILPGKTYDQVIEDALEATRCVLVVWSRSSVASAWVRAEADDGRQRGILVPVLIEAGVRLPLAFRQIQAANLTDWQGEETHPEFAKMVRALTDLLGAAPVSQVAESELEVEAPPEPQDESSTVADVEVPMLPPPDPPPQTDRKPSPEFPRVREQSALPGKKLLPWGLAVVLLLSLSFLYKALQSPEKDPSSVSTRNSSANRSPGKSPPSVAEPPVKPKVSLEPTWTNSIGMEFVLIKVGEFQMGSADRDQDEKPVHKVRITQPFYLGKYEVTQKQWQTVMGNNPSYFTGDEALPVEQISWEDVSKFIDTLNKKENCSCYRLPTEAEWEYAARAGTTTAYSFGDDVNQLSKYAWYDGNSGSKTHPVGKRESNPWGLYDMHGNVWEWVQDWYAADYYAQFVEKTAVDPTGPAAGAYRVARGGGWDGGARYCRSADRGDDRPGSRIDDVGLRLLRTVL